MMPKLKSDNYEGLELIRPLFLVREDAVLAWKRSNDLTFLNCACSFTEKDSKESVSKRTEIKRLIKDLKKLNPDIDYNIFKAMDNVNLNCILGSTKDGEYHSFLDNYNNN